MKLALLAFSAVAALALSIPDVAQARGGKGGGRSGSSGHSHSTSHAHGGTTRHNTSHQPAKEPTGTRTAKRTSNAAAAAPSVPQRQRTAAAGTTNITIAPRLATSTALKQRTQPTGTAPLPDGQAAGGQATTSATQRPAQRGTNADACPPTAPGPVTGNAIGIDCKPFGPAQPGAAASR